MFLALPTATFAVNAIEADLAMAYGPSGAAYFGGEDNIQVVVANCVAGNNLFNDQSGTGARMRIAGFFMSTNDPVNQDNGTVLGWVAGYTSNNNYDFSDVRNFGANVGADLVLWVSPNTGAAGNAYQPGVYSCIAASQIWAAVLAHETGGHNYGRTHNDGVPNPKTIMLHNYCGGGGAAPPYFYSNPNIWFNGVQLLGNANNNCGMGALVNNGDNSNPTYCGAQAVADFCARVVTAPNLNRVVLHWMFTNAPGSAPASTTNYDLVSRAAAVVRGTGATYTGTALRIPGGTTGNVAVNSMSAYIDLPNGIISSRTNLTIEIWATPLSAPNWARICDFGRCTQTGDGAAGEYTGTPGSAAPGATTAYDDLTLSADINTDITQQRFEAMLAGGNTVTLDAGLATTAGVQHHYAITFTDGAGAASTNGGRWQWFRDGDAVAFLDVTNHLSAIHDVNNWLGRSMYSGDNNANNDYAEVRVSNVALSRNQILANYLLGPNYIPTANVTLTNSDATSASSFNAAGQWSNGAVPSAGNNYETYGFSLGTPANGSSYTFGGGSLKLSGGSLLWQGTASSTITMNNLTLNGATVRHAGSGTGTLAGSVTVTTNGAAISAVNGAMTIPAGLNGNGPVTYLANVVTLSGANSGFTGKTCVGNGAAATVSVDSETRFGALPAAFTPDQLTMNRGTLQTATTMTLSNDNRGILLDVSGGTFNVASGTTLTLSSTLSSPATAANIVVGSLTKAGPGTLVLNSPSNTFKGTFNVDSGSGSANDGVVRLVNNTAMVNAHSVHVRNSGSGSSTLQLDGSAGSITLPTVYLNGRSSQTPAIQSLAGTNTLAGGINTYGSGSCLVQVDAGVLNVGGTITTSDGGADTITFQGSGAVSLNGTVVNGGGTMSVNKAGNGTLTFGAGSTYTGATTVSQGTLTLQPPSVSTPVLHLTFNNAAGSGNGSVITNTGLGGTNFNGTLTGTASIVAGGRFGNALNIPSGAATAAYVLVTNAVIPLNATAGNNWSVGLWLKTTTAGAAYFYQGDGGWASGNTEFYLENGTAGDGAGTHAGGVRWGQGWESGTAAVNNGQWHFVMMTCNNGTKTQYVDGALDALMIDQWGDVGTGGQVRIGGTASGADSQIALGGLIDEVFMFNRALSQAEIQSLYNNNAITNTPVNTLPVATTLNVAASGVLDLAGVSQTVAGLSGSGVVTNSGGAATLTVSNVSGSTLFSGKISDASVGNAVSLIKGGSGITVFAGANTYHGSTTVNGGTLKLSPVADDSLLHLTFNNAAGSGNGTIITNTGLGGTNFNGTLTGTASIVAGGRFGNALNIPSGAATAAYVLVTNAVVPLNATAGNNWSVGLWLKTSTAGAAYFYQGDGGWASGNTEFYLENGTAGDGAGTHAGGVRYAQGWESGTAAVNNGQWHFVMMTCNNGTKTQYVDGALDALMIDQWGDVGTGGQVRIGGTASGADSQIALGGLIDEVFMFNRALSQSEVQALYNNNNLFTNTGNVLPAGTPVSVASGATLDLGGVSQTIAALTGNGAVTNTGSAATLIISNSTGSTTFSGVIGDTSLATAVSLVLNGGATNILSGANTYRGATVVNGGALFVNGSLGSGAVTNGAWLGGNGTLGGAVTVKSGGTLSPGTGVGKLTVNSSVTLQTGSTTFMEISKSPKTNDQLIAGSALNYGGTLIVTNLGGTLAAGDSFVLFQAGSFNGRFASNSLPPLNAGLGWNTAALNSGILNVIQATPTNLVWSVSGTNLTLSWPADHTGWRLLMQTNNLSAGISLNTNDWTTVPSSPQTNQLTLPVEPTLPLEFYRLVFP